MIRRLLFADLAPGKPFHAYLRRPDFAFPSHCHDFWEAFLCVGGSGVHEYNGQAHRIAPGDLWLVRPDDVHSVRPQRDFAFINVAWPIENWSLWRNLAQFDAQALGGRASAPQLEPLFRGLTQSFFENASTGPLELCRFWAELALVFRNRSVEARPDWMLRALQVLESEEGLRGGWPLLVQTAHVSPGHICREWKKVLGQTPTAWINARRLENAARLLLQSNLPIEEVSTRCGFENTTYFYRLFGHRFGLPPRAYRHKKHPAGS